MHSVRLKKISVPLCILMPLEKQASIGAVWETGKGLYGIGSMNKQQRKTMKEFYGLLIYLKPNQFIK